MQSIIFLENYFWIFLIRLKEKRLETNNMKKSDKRKQKMKSQSGGVSSASNPDKILYQRPIYTNYCANINGEIMHLKNKTPRKGNKHTTGYLTTSVSKESSGKPKSYSAHRFIWECINEIIPEAMVIDHVNDNKEDRPYL